MANFEDLVRNEAYLIWHAEGCPAGQDARHWALAAERVRARMTPVKAPVIPLPLKRIMLSVRPKAKVRARDQELSRVSA